MGNTESNVTSGVKKQAGVSTQKLYKLVDLKASSLEESLWPFFGLHGLERRHISTCVGGLPLEPRVLGFINRVGSPRGGGLLVDMMKRASVTKQYAELDHAIKTKVEPFLYNKGRCQLVPIAKLVLLRNKERSRAKMLPVLKAMENPEDYDINKDLTEEDSKLDPSKCREVCWDLNERGAVGETILHLCLLNATSIHADLAKRLLKFYPKLINDIYMSDEYYGESVLHVAIVNEDPSMVKFLLDSGADFHERCFGNFMSPEDQKASRSDSQDHEWINVTPDTNYDGYVYWGEYPLSFAACLGQEECYRLILARGANPDNQDTNGNTVLHMLVIYQKLVTFDMAYEVGASLSVRNMLNLTPLTLSAKLARIEMFFHILNIEREIYWQIGSITCAAYPLPQIDTIDSKTGNISKDSALNLVVFGVQKATPIPTNITNNTTTTRPNPNPGGNLILHPMAINLASSPSTFSENLSSFQNNLNSPTSSRLHIAKPETTIQNQTTTTTMPITPARYYLALTSILPSNLSVVLPLPYILQPEMINKSFSAVTRRGNVPTESQTTRGSRDYSILPVLSYDKNESFQTLKSHMNDLLIKLGENSRYINEASSNKLADTQKKSSGAHGRSLFSGSSMMGLVRKKRQQTGMGVSEGNLSDEATLKDEITSTESAKEDDDGDDWWEDLQEECRLMQFTTTQAQIRIIAELGMEAGAVLYILAAMREARFLGLNMFIENLMTAPSRVMFLSSCILMLFMPLLRLSCLTEVEDMVAVFIMLTTAPYFLFFCRGFKTVGPFVVMIYRMVTGDLLRFVSIYLVFVMGFSQGVNLVLSGSTSDVEIKARILATFFPVRLITVVIPSPLNASAAFYIIFLSFDNPKTPEGVDDTVSNPMPSPMESVMAMFLMSMTNFGDYYGTFEQTDHEIEAKWARIVLVVERGVCPSDRLKKLMAYSQPMSDGRRALVLRLNQSEDDKEEMKEILEMKRVHDRIVKKRLLKGQSKLSATPSPKRLAL
nr:unnamed protein product [Timema californicum]